MDYVKKNFNTYLEDLKTLVRIPSVSFDGFPADEVEKSAQAVAELLKKRGLENVQILKLGKAHPYVYAERLKAPGKPTLLFTRIMTCNLRDAKNFGKLLLSNRP